MQFVLLCLSLAVAASARPWSWDSSSASTSELGSYASSVGHNCDLSGVELPAAPTPLPKATGTLTHVLVGRGTQNYTCDLSNSTAVPTPVGAIATLFDASCVIKSSSQLAALLTSMAYGVRTNALPSLSNDPVFNSKFTSTSNKARQTLFEKEAAPFVMGHHFFVDSTTPRFDLDTTNGQQGTVNVTKVGVSDAPSTAQEGSVAWLYLAAVNNGQTQDYTEVYRVETMGGNAPATCKEAGQAKFQVRYSAQYWFYK